MHYEISIEIQRAGIGNEIVIVGNEPADRLAKAAASDSDAKIVNNLLPMSTLISKIQEETKIKWQKEWEECTKVRITKEFFFKGA